MKSKLFIQIVFTAIVIFAISGYLFAADTAARVYDREDTTYVPLYNAQVVWEFEGEPPLIQYTDINGKCSTTHDPSDSCMLSVSASAPGYTPVNPASGSYTVYCYEQFQFTFIMDDTDILSGFDLDVGFGFI